MPRSPAILAFVVLFGAFTALLVFAASREVEHPTAAEAFFEKYQQRAPRIYRSGLIEVVLTTPTERRTAYAAFDTAKGTVLHRNFINGSLEFEKLLYEQTALLGAETRLPQPAGSASAHVWESEPSSVRFREDPRAKDLGARQLIVEFRSNDEGRTALIQLLTIDSRTHQLLFAESSWGFWDSGARTWVSQTSRRLSQLNEVVSIPASLP